MRWKTVLLDLARCEEFPDGSAHRHYLIDFPFDQNGRLDAKAALASPGRAIVRRYWPSAPDIVGIAKPDRDVWAIEFRKDHLPKGALFFGEQHLEPGAMVRVAEPDSRVRDYVVAAISAEA